MKLRLPPILVALSMLANAHAAVPGADLLVGLISKHFDANSDGVVEAGEWQSGMNESFDELDEDGGGSIAMDEVDALKSSLSEDTGELGAALAIALIKQIVLGLDKDADKLVSRKEFGEGGEAMFKKLDADTDGKVTKAELAELPARLLK